MRIMRTHQECQKVTVTVKLQQLKLAISSANRPGFISTYEVEEAKKAQLYFIRLRWNVWILLVKFQTLKLYL